MLNSRLLPFAVLPLLCGVLISVSSCGKGDSVAESPKDKKSEKQAEVVTYDWSLFRGDAEMQGVSREDLAAPLELVWTYEPPVKEGRKRPPFKASPVISEGRIYVGGQDAKFRCLDLETGDLIWEIETEGTITAPGAVAMGMVFVGDTFGIVYGLNAETGDEIWRFEAQDKIEGGINALAVDNRDRGAEPTEWRIFFGSHDFSLYSLAAETGEIRWAHETENYVMATPAIEASLPAITFGGCDGILYICSAKDGKPLHEVELGQYIANSTPIRDGIAYAAHYGGEVVAIDVATGEIVWKTVTGVEYHGSPAVTKDLVIVPGTDKRLVAYDRVTGDEVWAFQGRRDFEASPVVCESAIWIGGMDARLYAIDPMDGSELWNYDLGAQMSASPALSRGTLVICGEDGLVYGFRQVGSLRGNLPKAPAKAPPAIESEDVRQAPPEKEGVTSAKENGSSEKSSPAKQ